MTKDDIVNALHYGDCLEVMREWPDGFADLVYLDPPFNSNADYNILFGKGEGNGEADEYQAVAFQDTWHWNEAAAKRVDEIKHAAGNPAQAAIAGLHTILGECGMLAYLSYMAQRLVEIKRVVSPTGSIYLHCNPTAGHYLKVIMDSIFNKVNFLSEIAWQTGAKNNATKKFGSVHDTIFAYAASQESKFNAQYVDYTKDYIKEVFLYVDDDGERYTTDSLTDNTTGRAYEYNGIKGKWSVKPSKMKELDMQGMLEFSTTGKTIYRKRYLRDAKGRLVSDIWSDCYLHPQAKERLGYFTQKPLALMNRIVQAATDKGDIVLDPFCGCGTTIDAANRLQRRWAGIDISHYAIELVRKRRLKDASIPVRGVPTSIDAASDMARSRPFEFEKWALSCIPGIAPNNKQIGDGGIDGRGYLLHPLEGTQSRLVLAQVKGGQYHASQFRDFIGVVLNRKAAMGIYVTLDKPTAHNAYAQAAELGSVHAGASEFPKMQLWSIADYFEKRKPDLPPLADPVTGKAMHPDMFAG